jgi:mannose-6-phosphate isomerase-like protein (cupin superfamily)
MKILSKNSSLNHYQWGENNECDGWVLVDDIGLSVKLERIPPHTAEQKHIHQHAQQFFYILKGNAVFEIGSERVELSANQGIHIPVGEQHKVLNEGDEDLELILSSQPPVGNDRMNIE